PDGRLASPHPGENRPAPQARGPAIPSSERCPSSPAQSTMATKDQGRKRSHRETSRMNVDLARIQFAFTTINHFFFVPVTMGLAFLTALLQTAWYRSRREEYLRLTRFFGTLLVINIAIGVVTGLVQEFEFGMNWGQYSRLVGNIFGAPLAMEGLAAF